MKTTYDAVNEFKGEWIFYFEVLCNSMIEDGYFALQSISFANADEYLVCTRDQFNDLVLQMETNFGIWSEIAIQAWKDGDKVLLTKSTKELEVMDIDWSEAPEGCIGAVKGNNSDTMYQFGVFVKECDGFDGYQYCHEQEAFTFIPRPQPTPTYTQAMADNGELPSVGMECLLSISEFAAIHSQDRGYNGSHCEVVAHVDTLAVAVVRDENSDVCFTIAANYGWFKPLTPPIELIDGKAYQFELCFGDYRVGYYCSVRNSFFDGLLKSHKICGKAEATNIQPLTVEVK